MVPSSTAPPATTPALVPSYCYPAQYALFLSEVTDHELTVLHDDYLYRHLRFAKPGTRIWSFDLITWPNYLTIVGDIGDGNVFSRTPDMLQFFDIGQPDGHINPSYWAEKRVAGRRPTRTFSAARFVEHVNDCMNELAKGLPAEQVSLLHKQVARDVLPYAGDESDALDALNSFQFLGQSLDDEPDQDAWTDYDPRFITALHAILWGAKRYHAHVATSAS